MRTQFICLALVIVLFCPCATAQWVQTNGPYGGTIQCLALSGTNLFAGTYSGGIFLSANNGASWTAVNADLTNKNVRAFAVSGTNLFAGTSGSGVFLSANNGASWTAVNSGLTSPYVNALAISPPGGGTGSTNLFAGTSGGVFLSANNGASWTAAGLTSTNVRAFTVSGTNLFAGTDGDGVFLSTNNGGHWTAVNNGLTNTYVYALAISPGGTGTGGTNLIAGTSGGVFLSSNNGDSWTEVKDGLTNTDVRAFVVSDTNLFAGTFGGGVFLSSNNGDTWTEVNAGLTNTDVRAFVVSDMNLFAGTAGGGVFLSSNNGGSWTEVNAGLTNTDVHAFVVNDTNLFAGTAGGGVFLSTDGGTSWTAVNSGLAWPYVNDLAISPAGGETGGTYLFAGTYGGGVFLSSNNGASWAAVNEGLTSPYVNALAISPPGGGTGSTNLFAGTDYGGVCLSTNWGTSWTSVTPSMEDLYVLVVAAIDTDLFFGTVRKGIFRSTNNGTSWIHASNGLRFLDLGFGAIAGIATNLFAGGGFDGIYLSTDRGVSWTPAKTGIAGPDDHVAGRCFAVSGANLFSSTSRGLFLSTNNGTNWTSIGTGFTGAYVVALSASGTNLFAGTAGSGVWRRPLSEMIPPTGTLAVTVHNAEDWGGPGTEGRVTLFSPTGAFVAQQSTDTSGVTAFSSVPAGTGYSYTVNQVRPENAAIPHLYWGKKSGVSIADTATTTESFTRNAPYNLEWHIYDTTTNQSVYTTTIGRWTGLRSEVIVRNPSYSGALDRTVRSRMVIDRDKVPPYDLVISSSNALLGVGATRTDKMYFTLNANGSYFVTSVEYADSDGQEVETDGEPWSTTPFLTVTDPAFPIPLAPPHMTAGLDTPVTVLWTRAAGASSFHLQVGRDSTFTPGLILHDFPTVDTFAVLHSLSFLTSYWWHVNAYNPATGISAFSHPWQFSTGLSLPGTITLVDPSQNAVVNADTLLLRWKATEPQVDRYWLEYSVDSVFTLKAIDSLLTDTTAVIRNMIKSMEYYWRVRAHNLSGWGPYSSTGRFLRSLTAVNTMPQGIPGDLVLMQNYPNPFNPSTTIRYGLPNRSHVMLTVFNTLGRQVAVLQNGEQDAGYHEVKFDGSGLSSGVYFYRMRAGSFVQQCRLLLLK